MTTRNFTPFPVLQTERLILRQLTIGDDADLLSLRSNNEVNKYLNRKASHSIDDTRAFILSINKSIESNNALYWIITLRDTNQMAGTVCLYDFSDAPAKAEIGYELLPEFQGKGLMHETLRAVVYFGFNQLGLATIEAYTHIDNQRSINSLEKFSFKEKSAANENLIRFELTHDNLQNSY